MMNYDPNTTQWRKGDLVLHDADAKEPKMLMKVIGYTRDGLCKTQYLFESHKRTIWENEIAYLHDPEQWLHGAKQWANHRQGILEGYHRNFRSVRLWNRLYPVHTDVVTTSADGAFRTYTITEAKFIDGQAVIWLKRGGQWALDFVEAIKPEIKGQP